MVLMAMMIQEMEMMDLHQIQVMVYQMALVGN
jgi:hypothetical protein